MTHLKNALCLRRKETIPPYWAILIFEVNPVKTNNNDKQSGIWIRNVAADFLVAFVLFILAMATAYLLKIFLF